MIVREAPPLRTTVQIKAHSGKRYRWASDEPRPENVPAGLRWSSTMPGGFESLDCQLPRLAGIDYADLEQLSTLLVLDASGSIVGEYRLERAPRTTGDQFAISPSAVGWQAHLQDNKAYSALFVDRGASSWAEPGTERLKLVVDNGPPLGATIQADGLLWTLPEEIPAVSSTERWWSAPAQVRAARIQYVGTEAGDWAGLEVPNLITTDDPTAGTGVTGHALTLDGAKHDLSFAAARYLFLRASVNASDVTPPDVSGAPAGTRPSRKYDHVAVYGDHGLTLVPTRAGEPDGLLASDVIPYAIRTGAPLIRFDDETITRTSFAIPHLPVTLTTTVAEIIRQATRFGLEDWAVWEHLTFYLHPRGARGRSWRARVAPAKLEETGPQVDRLWESIVVAYTDAGTGNAVLAGPPGSGCDVESSYLRDTDPDNPANQAGITRRDLLQAGTLTDAGAIEIGRRFLLESRQLDTSGRAQLVGTVEDARGIVHPYHHVRAGDTIVFVDAADPSPRRIVRADNDESTATCSVDLDAPPEGLQALLERLDVDLIAAGLS